MKIIAFYLPQFHQIPENDAWWGEGFTEWVNVKKAQPLYPGHNQPRVPQGGNYYNLLEDDVKAWQVKIAKENGIYGFCMYHYWFDGHMLLEQPVNQYLENKNLDLPFCICWANEHWTNAWTSKSDKIFIMQKYGSKPEWKAHFEYLLPFLKDERYIQVDGKPLFVIYRPEIIGCLNEMLDCWQELAMQNGLEGITFVYQQADFRNKKTKDDSRFPYYIEYQPIYANRWMEKPVHRALRMAKQKTVKLFDDVFHTNLSTYKVQKNREVRDYDKAWNTILAHAPGDDNAIPGAFVDWDNTPRRGERGSSFAGVTPEKFEKYMSIQIERAKKVYHKDMLFLFAWNEWAEGGYLEPDEQRGAQMLNAVKNALDANGENPWRK